MAREAHAEGTTASATPRSSQPGAPDAGGPDPKSAQGVPLPWQEDLRAVWHHAAAPGALKKRILRTVLHEIVIDSPPQASEHLLRLHWQGGVHTELRVARNTAGKHGRATERDVMELIRELSKVCRDLTIAATLNRLGYRTGTGKTWRAHSVACVRYQYRLPNFVKGHDWLTLTHAAQQWGVSATMIKRCVAQGILPARQVVPQAPWLIQRTDLALPAVQAAVQGVHTRHRQAGTQAGAEHSQQRLRRHTAPRCCQEHGDGGRASLPPSEADSAVVGSR